MGKTNEEKLQEEVESLRRQANDKSNQPIIIAQQGGGGSSPKTIFWIIFHLFITLPLSMFVGCAVVSGIVSAIGDMQ